MYASYIKRLVNICYWFYRNPQTPLTKNNFCQAVFGAEGGTNPNEILVVTPLPKAATTVEDDY